MAAHFKDGKSLISFTDEAEVVIYHRESKAKFFMQNYLIETIDLTGAEWGAFPKWLNECRERAEKPIDVYKALGNLPH